MRERSSAIEFLMWCRRRRWVISPLILAALGAARESGEKRHDNGHVSPTFMIDGLVQADMSSGGPVVDWVSRLLKQ